LSRSELELVAEAKNGCKEAFEMLFRKHQDYIYNLLFQLTGDPAEADDLAQETFIRVYEKLPSFRAESSLRTWVSVIAMNMFRQSLRKKPHPPTLKIEEIRIPGNRGNPERIVIKSEMQWCIAHVLHHHMPRHFREVLILRDLQGFSYKEICEILGLSMSTVKTRIHRARTAFRDHFVADGCKAMVDDYLCICDGVDQI
jgi:RNA polymerase sigma-70 factor (ECF subfamily)